MSESEGETTAGEEQTTSEDKDAPPQEEPILPSEEEEDEAPPPSPEENPTETEEPQEPFLSDLSEEQPGTDEEGEEEEFQEPFFVLHKSFQDERVGQQESVEAPESEKEFEALVTQPSVEEENSEEGEETTPDGDRSLQEEIAPHDVYEKAPKVLTSDTSSRATPRSSESLTSVYSKLSPYFVKWGFGLKKSIGLINLTTPTVFEVFYVASHLGVIFDYRKNSMRFLPGHNFPITCISGDSSGRWLVTADAGEDTVIIVWDNQYRLPVWTLYNAFPAEGARCVAMSQDARFLAATNWGFNQILKFWLWTFGNDDPDAVMELDPSFGTARHIDFDHLETEQFAVTTDKKVIFCKWVEDKKSIEISVTEVKRFKGKMGSFRETLFLEDRHRALTSTSLGQIVVWCDVPFTDPIMDDIPGHVDKKYLKTIRIHKTGITSMRQADRVIVTASGGSIAFHDQALRLIYWIPKFDSDPIISISFHLVPRFEDQTDPFSNEFHDGQSQEGYDLVSGDELEEWEIEDFPKKQSTSHQYFDINQSKTLVFDEKYKTPSTANLPSDCTLEMRPFLIRDFLFLTSSGKIGYVSHVKRKLKYFLYKCEAPVMSLDCSPHKTHLAVGNAAGRLSLYQFKTKEMLLTVKLADCAITCLKYSPSGLLLVAGLDRGDILILDSLLLEVKFTFEVGSSKIVKICFSSDSRLFAFFDASLGVCLYSENEDHSWVFMGRYNSHYKPIKDLLFEEEPENPSAPRLFSLGEDRMLVEYDTQNLEKNRLKLIGIDRIEQSAVPCCFAWHPKFHETGKFLIANNEYKIKVVEMNSRNCCKTTLGPMTDTPVTFMRVIPDWDQQGKKAKMIYATDKHIGLRLLPPTGNPFEGMGLVGHPEKLCSIAVSHDYKYIFTTGINDSAVLMWKLNPKSVDIAHQLGGEGLEPFLTLIEGGPSGFLFKEMEDFFYYAQIIHQGDHANLDRSVNKCISLCEVPDLIRSLGFYPTDYEVKNMLYELKHLKYEETKEQVDEVSFDECVKIYLNHRPINGISMEAINKALLTIADLTDPEEIIVERNELYKALEEHGEAMDHAEVVGYLNILLLPKDETQPVPLSMPLGDFADEVLGIDITVTENNVREVTHAFQGKDS